MSSQPFPVSQLMSSSLCGAARLPVLLSLLGTLLLLLPLPHWRGAVGWSPVRKHNSNKYSTVLYRYVPPSSSDLCSQRPLSDLITEIVLLECHCLCLSAAVGVSSPLDVEMKFKGFHGGGLDTVTPVSAHSSATLTSPASSCAPTSSSFSSS